MVTFDKNGGDVDASPTSRTTNYNTTVILPAAPTKTGYTFSSWNTAANGSGSAFIASTAVTADLTVYAQWTINTYTVTFDKNGGTVDASPTTRTTNYNTTTTLPTPPTKTGYTFTSWNTAANGSGSAFIASTAVTADATVYAQWTINTFSLTYTVGSNGTLTGTTNQTINYGSNGSQITAVPDLGYHFTNWSDDSTSNPRTDTNITNNITVTANFAINTYTLTYAAVSNGTIDGISPQTINYGSDGTQITAVPATHYHFLKWSDNSTQNPRTDTNITSNKNLTASFSIDTYSLTYTAGAHGSITGNTNQTINHGSNGTLVTAVPDQDFYFVNWSDGSTTNPRTDTNITNNKTITANFTVTITISGVENNQLYFEDVTPIFNSGTATLNGNSYTSNTPITTNGHYTLTVTDSITTLTYTFDILKNKTVLSPNTDKLNADFNLGLITVPGSDPTNTTQATINTNYTLQENNYTFLLPRDTTITESNSQNFNVKNLTVANIAQTIRNIVPNSKGAIKIGIPDVPLTFSKEVTVSLPVDPAYNGKTLKVYYRPDNGTTWTFETTCDVANALCTFQTTHASEFTANYEVSNELDPTHVNVDINSTITIDCKDKNTNTNDYINMNPITGTGQSQLNANNDVNCNVITNNSSGYTLSFASSTPELINANNDKINSYTPATTNTPETWNVPTANSEWGARLESNSTTYNPTIWGPTNTDDYSAKWYAVTNQNSFILANRSNETLQTGDDQIIRFGAEIGSSKFQPTGTYTDNVTFTAVTN